jgi:hypothetical protein
LLFVGAANWEVILSETETRFTRYFPHSIQKQVISKESSYLSWELENRSSLTPIVQQHLLLSPAFHYDEMTGDEIELLVENR